MNQMADTLEENLSALQREVVECSQAQESVVSANNELEQRVEERTTQLTAEIVERTRAEKELYQRDCKYEFVINAIGEGIHALDLEGRIIFENPAAEKILGWETGELIGKPAHATMHHSKAGGAPYPQCECPIYASLRDGSPRRISDEVFWRKDGTSFPVEYVATPIRDESRKIIGAVVAFSDNTERKRAEQELHHAKEAAEAANCAKSEFLANMSHEIRTPMNGVIGMSDLLLDTSLTGEQRGFAQTIRSSGEALLTVVNDILDFSKMEAGKLTFEQLDFNLHGVLEGTLELLAERSQTKKIELAGFIEPVVPTRLRGDAGRIRQVLINLVGNAIKFTETGEVTVRVSCDAENERDCELRFKVTDTGMGIAPETQKKLFEAFSQGDTATTRKFGGTGLGLAISSQLVQKMGGDIGLESALGKGSTFWFTVRLQKSSALQSVLDGHHRLVNMRVLVVDDDTTSRRFLHEQIAAWKMRNGTATTRGGAVDCLRRAAREGDSYPLAIIDLEMPNMDGLALAREIKADPEIAGTRLILLADFGKRIISEELRATGFADCCFKPVRQSMLFNCLANAVLKVSPASHSPSGSPALPRPLGQQARVLVAEDNVVNQQVALGQLKRLGYTADAVPNGLAVLEALDHTQYDIILMDCQMPEMDGYEATRRIRARRGNFPPPYIIAVTAHAMQGASERCLAAGMNDYISKPILLETFAAALARGLAAGAQTTLLNNKSNGAGTDGVQRESESALCKKTSQGLRELGLDMGASFFPQLLETFEHDAVDHLAVLRSAIADGETGRLCQEAHALKGASLTIGARGMADICQQLESLGTAHSVEDAPEVLGRLEREFDRVKNQIEQESLIP